MANAKRKCRNCGKYDYTYKMIQVPMGFLCSDKCVQSVISKGRKKHRKQAQRQVTRQIKRNRTTARSRAWKQKRKRQRSSRRIRLDGARMSCNRFIRERDQAEFALKKEHPKCICCGKKIKTAQAGHYLASGSNPKIRYDPDNIHLQDLECNYFSGGDSGMYRVNLIKKIGLKRVLRLESFKGGLDTRTTEHLLHIEKHYKAKLNKLLKGE